MISASNYGHSGFTSMAYYHFGITNNFQKLGIAGPTVEAGWLSGFNAAVSGSNLGPRAVNLYNQTGAARFATLASGLVAITARVVPQHMKRALLTSASTTWKLYA